MELFRLRPAPGEPAAEGRHHPGLSTRSVPALPLFAIFHEIEVARAQNPAFYPEHCNLWDKASLYRVVLARHSIGPRAQNHDSQLIFQCLSPNYPTPTLISIASAEPAGLYRLTRWIMSLIHTQIFALIFVRGSGDYHH